jgi:hypothetical protein
MTLHLDGFHHFRFDVYQNLYRVGLDASTVREIVPDDDDDSDWTYEEINYDSSDDLLYVSSDEDN